VEGACSGAVGCGRSGVRSPMLALEFLIDIILLHYGRGVDTVSNRNEYQEYILKRKTAGL